MTLAAGKRLGSYEILALIGAGGMGEVYRARDTRLERTVAIKILPEHVSGDADLRQRFEREAKAISSLNHPHICTLYDVGREDGVEFIVMELLEGETTAQRLARGPIPFPQVLRYGVEIAEALDRAHRQGVTHRDLKPGNIMLTKSGAKLLDFGLAKLKPSPVQVSSAATASPDLLTASGTILGTLQYMAPEQLEGKVVDHRADIFAFGAIVYEMATGKTAFEGESQARLIGAIIKDEPRPISALQPLSPPAFDALIATCLAKDPDERWQSAADLGRQLRLLQSGSSQPSLAMSSPAAIATTGTTLPPVLRGWRFALAALAGVAVGGVAVWALVRPAPPPAPVTQFLITPPDDAPLASSIGYDLTISPDGRRVAYVASRGSGSSLYLRDLDSVEPRAIPGTDSPASIGSPFFSGDGRSLAFVGSANELMRVSLDGGPPLKIADIPAGAGLAGGAWSADDSVIFSNGVALYRVSAGGGGSQERLTGETQGNVVGPVLLPGGRGVLFGLLDARGGSVAVLDLESREQRVIAAGGENAAYSPSGHLVFARGTTLMAQRFDLERLDVVGEPVALLQDVRRPTGSAADFALAANGTLVYVPADSGAPQAASKLVWVDRSGRAVAQAVEDSSERQFDPRLSPDGGRVVVSAGFVMLGSANNLWVHDLGGRPPIVLTDGTSDNRSAIWSPDGKTIAFVSNRAGNFVIQTLPADGSAREPQAIETLTESAPKAWTTDGELLLTRPGSGNGDVFAARFDDPGNLRAVVATADAENQANLSPNERWLAYNSNRTGRPEVWVKKYPDGVSMRVSRNGGTEPVWSRDGRELFYRQGDTMMAMAVDTSADSFSFEPAQELFTTSPYFATSDGEIRTYDVAPDGRFLMIQWGGTSEARPSAQIVVIENWIEEVKRRVPAR
jgi:Tol biopolymer transport system component